MEEDSFLIFPIRTTQGVALKFLLLYFDSYQTTPQCFGQSFSSQVNKLLFPINLWCYRPPRWGHALLLPSGAAVSSQRL